MGAKTNGFVDRQKIVTSPSQKVDDAGITWLDGSTPSMGPFEGFPVVVY